MPDTEALRAVFASMPPIPYADLVRHEIEAADFVKGEVRIGFEAQPLFGNLAGVVQGGFAMVMLDMAMSCAGYAATRVFPPTVEWKANFLAPLPIGPVTAVGRVVRAGRTLAFLEGTLSPRGGAPAVTASATAILRA